MCFFNDEFRYLFIENAFGQEYQVSWQCRNAKLDGLKYKYISIISTQSNIIIINSNVSTIFNIYD